MEVGIHGGVGGPVSENDGAAGKLDGESGEDGGVGWLERVIPFCPYVPNSSSRSVSQEPRRLRDRLSDDRNAQNLFKGLLEKCNN